MTPIAARSATSPRTAPCASMSRSAPYRSLPGAGLSSTSGRHRLRFQGRGRVRGMPVEGPLRRRRCRDRPMTGFSLIESCATKPENGFTRAAAASGATDALRQAPGLFQVRPQPRRRWGRAVSGARAPLRVRLTLDRDGSIDVTTAPFVPLADGAAWRVRIASTRLDSSDRLLRMKTTRPEPLRAARSEFSTARGRRGHPAQ